MPGITLTGTYISANQNVTWQVTPVGCQQHATKFDFPFTEVKYNEGQNTTKVIS